MPDEKPRTLGEVACEAFYTPREGRGPSKGRACWDAAAAAVEREVVARLAKAVAPMTMSEAFESCCRENDTKLVSAEVRMLLSEIDALRAALAARDAEIGRLREEHDTWKERSVSGADLIDTMTQQRADGERRAEALLSAALARAEAAERERDEARYALRAMTTDRDVAFRATSEATTIGIENTQTALREADLAHAHVASLESSLTRERAAHAALREAFAQAVALFDYPTTHFRTPEDDHEAMSHAVEELRAAAIAALRGEETKT